MKLPRPRTLDGKLKAVIVLTTSMALLLSLRSSVTVIGATFLLCTLLALWVGYHWLSFVSRPMRELVRAAAQVSRDRDYSLRAEKYEDDELGRLTDSFNHMLEQIETADRELQHANQELARSNSDLERFAYIASHDLQEPLRVVTSYSNLLADDLGDSLGSNARKYLGYVVSAAHRMRAMIDALLDYSRVGRQHESFATVDCRKALDTALANLRLALAENDAEVSYGELPVVLGGPHQLTQVFQNLIGNALKFRRLSEAPRIRVSCTAAESEWHLSVADNGIGMEPHATARIFGVFQRLHSRSEYPGTGIGLAICHRIVERHGGEMRVESTPDQGSEFFFTLPRIGGTMTGEDVR